MKTLFLLSFLLFVQPLAAMSLFAPSCEEVRGSFDIGSGSTKAYVALVDKCRNIILKPLLSEQTPIAFKDSLEKSADKSFSPVIIEEARIKYETLVQSMKELGAKRISAVATAAFRNAKNAEAAAEAISGSSGVPIKIITQLEEARLGVISARASLPRDEASEQPVAVWDIGGGSMQMSYFDDQGKAQVFEGDLASVSFKNLVISQLQKKNIQKTSSPNPLGALFPKAVLLAKEHSQKHSAEELKKAAPLSRWLGIGGVWWFSIRNQVSAGNVIHVKDLESTLKKRAALTDSQIGGVYAATEVTNMALVLGYMKGLKIEKVEPVEASLVEGLVLD